MEGDECPRLVPFQLQLEKPLPSHANITAWNLEKDLFAMVTEDSKLHLHRFNWQRLWTLSPVKNITSICWRPDGKVIAVGLEDGTISLHDVEDEKLLKTIKFHEVSVVCLNWEEDRLQDESRSRPIYEDRTARFFPSAPQAPRNPGPVPADASGSVDENTYSFWELFNASQGHFDILCSGDIDGNVHFNIFGIFPIGKVNIRNHGFHNSPMGKCSYSLKDASICKVAMSGDLCHMLVLCYGVLAEDGSEKLADQMPPKDINGFHNMVLNCMIFHERKNELHQVALQAANVERILLKL